MAEPRNYGYVKTANDTFGSPGKDARLWGINVNKAAASAVVTVYDDTAATGGSELAVIDAATKGPNDFYGIRCKKGLFVKLTGGNADCTIAYT